MRTPSAWKSWSGGCIRTDVFSTKLLADWYNKKDISVGGYRPIDKLLFSPALADELLNGYCFLEPVYQYFNAFCKAGLDDLK